MKKASFILLVIIFIALGYHYVYKENRDEKTLKDFQTWQTFIPQSGLFEVSLPLPPHYGKDFVEIEGTDMKKRYDVYASERIDGTLLIVDAITYPPEYEVSSSRDVLSQNIDELIRDKHYNVLKPVVKGNDKGINTVNFSFESQDYRIEGKAFHDHQIVYLLAYISRIDGFDEGAYQHFIDSFKILIPAKEVMNLKEKD